jgi:alpha-L-fucosidase
MSLTAVPAADIVNGKMSAYFGRRRDFIRAALLAPCLPFLPNCGLASASQDDRTTWYRRAKFGMFIHWGPYSVASVEASWPIMTPKPGGISESEYRALPKRFNPTKFDPNAFVDLARAAGQKYMVFTTKHHDGFCMFDSSYTNYKITNTPYGKDIVAALSKACEADGMPLGFYYSPPDMTHPGFRDTSKLAKENWQGEPARPEWPLYLDYMQLQLSELLTRYGPAALIWFDGLGHQEKYDGERFLKLIHNLQSKTLVNNRIGVDADFETPEQFIPKAIPTKGVRITGIDPRIADKLKQGVPAPEDFRLWETCMTINNTWAYNKNDHDYKSTQFLIRSLVEVASRGGNFLLNVGPQPDGTIQPEFQERLRGIGNWLETNGDSIYETTYGPVQGLSAVRTTAKGKSIYVHVFDWPSAALELTGVAAKVESARLLAGGKPLTFRQTDDRLQIEVPAQAPDRNVSVVALRTV